MSNITRETLLSATKAFIADLSARRIPTLLDRFSETCTMVEHGDLKLAPFTGREYTGREGVLELFKAIASVIESKEKTFEENIVVDEVGRVALVKARGTFIWKATGKSWEEEFIYVIEFDEEVKVNKLQAWGDTGGMYLASQTG